MRKMISLLLCLVLALGLLPLTASAATEVKEIKLTLEYPEAGKTPPGTATWLTQGYSIYSIDWYDRTADRYLETGDKIQAGHQYRATLWVQAMDGYGFANQNDNTPTVTAKVNGETCTVSKAYEYKAFAMVCVEYNFQTVPSKGWIRSVKLNFNAPVTGEKPDYTQQLGTGYGSGTVSFGSSSNENNKNGIIWYATSGTKLQPVNPNTGVFASKTEYTVFCTVLPGEGYAITRNATATVNGKAAQASLEYDNFLAVEYRFPKTGEATHTHVYTDWQYNSGQHYKNCTDCDDVFFVESHKGGTATCQADGKCSVCGYAYIKASEEYHAPDTTKYIARADRYHYHPCKLCGAHCDIGDHVAGPTGTPDTAEVCKDCGYIMTPAKNHTHKLTKVAAKAATCTEPGCIEHYTCSGCSQVFADAEGKTELTADPELAPLGHSISDTWALDEQDHWRTCTTCGKVLDETRMAHEYEKKLCTTCGYKKGSPISQNSAEPTEKPHKTSTSGLEREKDDGQNKQLLLLIAVPLVCFGAAITATVILLKRKRK